MFPEAGIQAVLDGLVPEDELLRGDPIVHVGGVRKATLVLVVASLLISFGLLLDGPHTGDNGGGHDDVGPLVVGIALSIVALAMAQIRGPKKADDGPKDFLLMAQAQLAQFTSALSRRTGPSWRDERLKPEFEALTKLHGVPNKGCFEDAARNAWLNGDVETSRKIRATYIDLALAYELAGGAVDLTGLASVLTTPKALTGPKEGRRFGWNTFAALLIALTGSVAAVLALGIHIQDNL